MLKYCLIHSIHTLAPYKNELLTTLVVAFNDDETGNKGIARNDVVTKLAWSLCKTTPLKKSQGYAITQEGSVS